MARIRSIKPEFFTSLSNSDLSIPARLTFIGLWTHCDDEGRCINDARLIKAAIWPLERTVKAVEGDLNELEKGGKITRSSTGPRHRAFPHLTRRRHGRISDASRQERNREQGREQGSGSSRSPMQ
jgi:hypothetical protein